jgi:polyisoprenyl-teichoic acid--peptidoglycan teichoic acid transferase
MTLSAVVIRTGHNNMRNLPGWLFIVGVLGLVASTALCAVVAFAAAQQIAVDAGKAGISYASHPNTAVASNPLPTPTLTPAPVEPTNTPEPGVTTAPTENVPTATIDPLVDIPEINDPGRITILLMGIDQRIGFDTDKAYRTDTMMLVNINPVTKQVGIISIPRDLWVSIPGFQPNRINTANQLGDANEYPNGGGPRLAAETVQQNFGIKVDKYVRINFNVFETLVDTLAPEGIEICITEEIYDPSYPDEGYGTIEVRFSPGCQKLKAQQLLQYARTRHTNGSDFDRARRQQQVLKAAQAHFLNAGGIANFITQIPALWSELSGSIVTNLTLEDILALGRLAGDIKPENINTGVIDVAKGHVEFGKSPQGDDILYPNFGAIQVLIRDTFYPQPPPTLADLRQRAEAENASVMIYNNTTIAGLAGKTQEWFIGKITIAGTGNIPEPTNTVTVIRDYGNHPWTARYLAKLLEISEDRIEPGRDGLISDGVMIVVGEDIQSMLSIESTTP